MASLRLSISLDAFDSKAPIRLPSKTKHTQVAEANPYPKPQLRGPNRAPRKNHNPNNIRETRTNLKLTHDNNNNNNNKSPTPDAADVDFSPSLQLSTVQCNAILKRLQRNADDAKTLSFFNQMKKTGKLEHNADAYNTAIRALTNREDWEGAEKLVHEMSTNLLNFRVFNTVIYACSKRGLVSLGAKWFRKMLELNVTPNTATLGMVMGLYRKGWEVEEAEFAMSQMKQLGIVCESAYSSMVTIYTRLGLYEKAESVIESMESEGVVVKNLENWLVVLNAYCQQGKMVESERVLERMIEELGFCPNVVANNIMITGYGKASDMESAERVFVSFGGFGLEPDETSYRSMIEGWGRAGNYGKAVWYYEELKRLGYKPSSSNLYTMMKLQAEHGEGEEGAAVGTLLDDMVNCGCQYSSVVGTLVRVYERAGKVHELPRLVRGSFYEHVLVNQSCCSTVVMAYVRHRLVGEAIKVLRDKKWRDPRYEDNLYHLLICSCKEAGLLGDAVGIYEEMRKSGDEAKPNKHIVCTMIDIYGAMGRFEDAERLYLELKSSGVSLDLVAFSIVVRMYVKAGSLKDACSVLDAMDEQGDIVPDVFLLRDMLRIYQRCNMVDKLADLYYKISKDRVNWDQELYNCVLNCCAQALPVDELSRVFDEMVLRGFMPNTITYNVMLDVFGKAKLFKKVKRLYCMARKQGLVDVITYNTIIAAYGKSKDFGNMSWTVQQMQFDGFSVSLEAYNSMLDAYGKDGQMETFRSVLQKMKESNCASDHYTYNTMINIYGEQGWIEEVADVLTELKECGLGPDLCSYNTLIKAYGIAGMVEDAVGLIQEMRKNGIEPDKKTYTNLITALRRNDKFLEAVKWSLWMKQLKL